MQIQLPDGVKANGGITRLSFGVCFENWLSCEYQLLYCLDLGDLIYQNEVIHPAREDKPSFQRINQAHQGPCLPPYLQPVRECAVINLTGPGEPPALLPGPLNQKATRRLTKSRLLAAQVLLAIISDLGDCFESRYFSKTKPRYASELQGFLLVIKLLAPAR